MLDRDVDREPFVHCVLTCDRMAYRRVQVVGLGLGEEADLAEIDPEQRHLRRPGEFRRPQQRAVPAEGEDQFDAVGRRRAGHRHHRGQVEVLGLLRDHPHGEARFDEILGHRTGVLGAGPTPGVRH